MARVTPAQADFLVMVLQKKREGRPTRFYATLDGHGLRTLKALQNKGLMRGCALTPDGEEIAARSE